MCALSWTSGKGGYRTTTWARQLEKMSNRIKRTRWNTNWGYQNCHPSWYRFIGYSFRVRALIITLVRACVCFYFSKVRLLDKGTTPRTGPIKDSINVFTCLAMRTWPNSKLLGVLDPRSIFIFNRMLIVRGERCLFEKVQLKSVVGCCLFVCLLLICTLVVYLRLTCWWLTAGVWMILIGCDAKPIRRRKGFNDLLKRKWFWWFWRKLKTVLNI